MTTSDDDEPAATGVLAIETADPLGGVAWRADGDGPAALAERLFDGTNQHAQRLVPILGGLLPAPPRPRLVVVDRGPGSHAGVRIGLATARMIGWQTGAPVIGVSSLMALALATREAGVSAPLLVVLPCRAGHLYAQRFAGGLDDAGLPLPAGDPGIVNVREALPDDWAGHHAIGRGLTAAPELQAAVQAGHLTAATANGRLPEWPTPGALLIAGERLASSLPQEEWHATLSPMYLAGVLAKTRAEREAAARQQQK